MIPFNRPLIVERSLDYLSQALANLHLSGDGPFTKKCQALLEKQLGVPKALLTTSCTDALEMAALLLDIQPGDEVIVTASMAKDGSNLGAARNVTMKPVVRSATMAYSSATAKAANR